MCGVASVVLTGWGGAVPCGVELLVLVEPPSGEFGMGGLISMKVLVVATVVTAVPIFNEEPSVERELAGSRACGVAGAGAAAGACRFK